MVQTPTKDLYAVLGVGRDASPEELHASYRRLATQYHPDVAGDEAHRRMAEINAAWDVLRDPIARSQYDFLTRPRVHIPSPPATTRTSEWRTWRGPKDPGGRSGLWQRWSTGQKTVATVVAVLAFLAISTPPVHIPGEPQVLDSPFAMVGNRSTASGRILFPRVDNIGTRQYGLGEPGDLFVPSESSEPALSYVAYRPSMPSPDQLVYRSALSGLPPNGEVDPLILAGELVAIAGLGLVVGSWFPRAEL